MASDRAPATKTLYEGLIRRHVKPHLGSIRLDRLKPSHVAGMLLALEAAGPSASTRRNAYAALRGALDDGVKDGLLLANPVEKVRRPRSNHAEARALTPDEVASFLGGGATLRYATAMKMILGTGLRRGEVLALRWLDVDLQRGEARVKGSLARRNGVLTVSDTKTRRSRTIALSPAVGLLLTAQRARQAAERLAVGEMWDESGFVFTTEVGRPVDPRNLLRAVKIAAAASGIDGVIGVHTLRHTYATAALLSGVPLHVVSRNLGHASVAVTGDIYGHVNDAAAQAAAQAVSAALGL